MRDVANALGPERRYWAALDVPFHRLMVDLADTFADEQGRSAQAEWAPAVGAAARDAFDGVAVALQGTARGLRAVVRMEDDCHGHLGRLLKLFLANETENGSTEPQT